MNRYITLCGLIYHLLWTYQYHFSPQIVENTVAFTVYPAASNQLICLSSQKLENYFAILSNSFLLNPYNLVT